MTMYDQISVKFGWFHEFIVHRSHRGGILGYDIGQRSPSFDGVTLDSPHESYVTWCILARVRVPYW
eukprot:CAMPEP_0201959090 /NCGR_PEP_ID=MMETSP0904-20121228/6138_1 /ASSEMBLY_ACC=CAM_ASM_000553 /TAXON_ID=420261 /ORGANISM="Thalassiosira antarctica, Strain CCMP982" /LENGTH=65 /DNA_ID=CAMNT_0048504659 /DNA_START=142 /DNA_END=336 /DNA_ORIENTATION=+